MSEHLDKWRRFIVSANDLYLNDIALIDNEKLLEEFMVGLESYLVKTLPDQFLIFLKTHDYAYVPQRIKERGELNNEFKQRYILLTYFLVKKYRMTIYRKWPFDMKILQGIYSDLGISCEVIST